MEWAYDSDSGGVPVDRHSVHRDGVDWWKSRINGFILGAFLDVHLYFHPYGHQILAAAGKTSMKMKACNA